METARFNRKVLARHPYLPLTYPINQSPLHTVLFPAIKYLPLATLKTSPANLAFKSLVAWFLAGESISY
jgi:hypothetical protein